MTGPQPFKVADSVILAPGVQTLIVAPIPEVYRSYLFNVMLLNQGGNGINVNFIDINGNSAPRQLLAAGGPGVTIGSIPWEKIAGGITAETSIGSTPIQFDVWSQDIKREALLDSSQVNPTQSGGIIGYGPETTPPISSVVFPVT